MFGNVPVQGNIEDFRHAEVVVARHLGLPQEFSSGEPQAGKVDPSRPVGHLRVARGPVGDIRTEDSIAPDLGKGFDHIPGGNLHPVRTAVDGDMVGNGGLSQT